jgi:DNA adenine methylase
MTPQNSQGDKVDKFSPVIKWSGSKRSQAGFIIQKFPTSYNRYFEPFIGGGAILYAASPKRAIAGDICEPLIMLWEVIQNYPSDLIESYSRDWNRLQSEGHEVYYEVRDRFNNNQNPFDLYFLSRTCVNGLIRFNNKGEFNNSLHHTRPGIHPDRASTIIKGWSLKLSDVKFRHGDYRKTTVDASAGDLIYLDPPYFNNKDRYYGTIAFDKFLEYLEMLNSKGIKYILSYDGQRGEVEYEHPLPESAYKRKFLVKSGNSPFRKVIDKKQEMVEEALYINW